MRTLLWLTVAFLLSSGLALIAYLTRNRTNSNFPPTLTISDLTGIISLAVNAALFLITIVSLFIAVAAYRASERSGQEQLETLKKSREALQTTAETLIKSADDFRKSAQAGMGQLALLQTEKRDRDDAVLSTLFNELSYNQKTVDENRMMLETELQVLAEKKSLITPLKLLHDDGWLLLRIYLPHQISGNAAVLSGLTETYRLTFRLNELLVSREDYRIHNGAMSNFDTRMVAYDEQLQEINLKILPELQKSLGTIESLQTGSPRKKPVANHDH